jgi:PAS domain S-box-containing protein
MNVEGRPWTVTYETGPGFAAGAAPAVTPLVLVGGTAVSLILFALARALARAAEAAERSAEGLRQSGAALRASEARFRQLFESNVVGVSFCDVGGRVIDGNDAYFRMLGYPKSEFTSGRLGWDQITPPEYREAEARALEQLRATGECPPFEKEYVRADGSRVPVLVGVALLDAASGECVTLNVDLTERKQAEERMRAATEAAEAARQSAEAARAEAEHANRIKDEFLATVSHELRTPLNAVLGWAQLLRGADSEPDDLAQGLETIERNARAQAQLIDDLLDVSRIVAGKLRLDVRTVDLAPVIEAAVDACRHAADAKGVHLTRVLDPQAGPVAGDPDRLQQVMWNLVSNAVKFTPRGGRVQVVLRRVESAAEITVSDTGQGIDAAFLPHVFDRFRQADASITRLHGGLGIGLSIVRNLVELHGGTVRASSSGPGGGAAFTVALPVAVSRDPLERQVDGRAQTAEADCPPLSLKGVRVLVVDDDPDARHLLARVLRDCDADVTMAASAAEAFDGFERAAPDVIVSDIGMPGEDGYSLIRRIRATEAAQGTNTPAVALTAFARPEDRRRAVLAGYQVHLPKPVEPGELRAVVANLVGRAPARADGPT